MELGKLYQTQGLQEWYYNDEDETTLGLVKAVMNMYCAEYLLQGVERYNYQTSHRAIRFVEQVESFLDRTADFVLKAMIKSFDRWLKHHNARGLQSTSLSWLRTQRTSRKSPQCIKGSFGMVLGLP